jgi:hypothetical protein
MDDLQRCLGIAMNVGDSVRLAIRDFEAGEPQASMMHACNAVDGTAAKLHKTLGPSARFKRALRDNYAILGPTGMSGINLEDSRFNVSVQRPSAKGGGVDVADVIWGVHRCSHGHGDALPDGFDLIADVKGPPCLTTFSAERGVLRLSDRMIFGLLAVAVLSPTNADQKAPDGYFLSYENQAMVINQWWGKGTEFLQVLASRPKLPSITMNLARLGDDAG